MVELVFTVILVITTSAFCSLCEAALYSVPIGHIEALAEEGKISGRILRSMRTNIDRPITAILSLNTIANTAGAAVAGAIAAKVLGSQWLGLFSGLFTLMILLLSEIIPKTIGVEYNRTLSPVIARPLLVLVFLFQPLIWMAGGITRALSRRRQETSVSSREILMMARLGYRRGVIKESESTVIQNILRLREKTVRAVMTPRTVVFQLSADTTVDEARKVDGFLTHSRIPVWIKSREHIEGIAHRRDVLTAVAESKLDVTLEELVKPVHFVLDRTRLDRVLKMFLERAEHMFVVIDEFGGLAGVITLEDVMEEILGREIVDEFDRVIDMRELAEKRREQAMEQLDEEDRDDIPPVT
jgi:CBS domain containing-hemolysin-like protein